MTDVIDVAQRRQQEEIDQALASRRVVKPGAPYCEKDDCGEPIATYRQAMGARLCVACQTRVEAEARSWARGAV